MLSRRTRCNKQPVSDVDAIGLMLKLVAFGGLVCAVAAADTVSWTGDGATDSWSDAENWSSFPDIPDDYDDVIINSDDDISQDVENLYHIKSLSVYGTPGGSVTVVETFVFHIFGDFWSNDAVLYSFVLEAGASLEMEDVGYGADLSYIDLTKEISDPNDTGNVFVDGDVINCTITDYGYSDFVIDGQISGSLFSLGPNSIATVGEISDSTFDVGSNASLSVASTIDCSPFSVHDDGSVSVSGGITGSADDNPADHHWSIDGGTVVAGDASTLFGEWIVDGGDVTFEEMSANADPNRPVGMVLKDTASVEVEESADPNAPFPDGVEHSILYGDGNNTFSVGTSPGVSDHFHVGTNTLITELSACTSPYLLLETWGNLEIATYFGDPNITFVQAWSTRNVDIDAPPIFDGANDEQTIEMISPLPSGQVTFADCPCHGQFGAFELGAHDPNTPGTLSATVMVNGFDNWPANFGATAFFESVHIGDYRTLKFDDPNYPTIYYSDPNGFTYGTGVRVMVGATEIDEPNYPLHIVHCTESIYGDWNGDCTIGNTELAALQAAINGGAATYNPPMDYNCDGVLDSIDLAAFTANLTQQPPCGGGKDGGGGGEKEEEETPPYEYYEDVPALAAWLVEELTEKDLEAFVADLDVAVSEFAGTPVGDDLASLFICLH